MVLNADLLIQAPRGLIERMLVVLQRFRLGWRSQSIARTAPLTASRPVRVLGYIGYEIPDGEVSDGVGRPARGDDLRKGA